MSGLTVPLPRASWQAMKAKRSRRRFAEVEYECIGGVAKVEAHWTSRRGSGARSPPARALPSPSTGEDGFFLAPSHHPFLLLVRHSCIKSFPALAALLPPPAPADTWRSAISAPTARLRKRSMRGGG